MLRHHIKISGSTIHTGCSDLVKEMFNEFSRDRSNAHSVFKQDFKLN